MPYPKQNRRKGPLIYLLTSPSGKNYVGQTVTSFERRMIKHKSAAKHTPYEGCTYLNAAINKYGFDNFEGKVLTYCDEDNLDELEQKYIEEYKSLHPNGYNLMTGGNSNKHLSNRTKTKTSIAHIRNSIKRNPGRLRYGCIFEHTTRINVDGKSKSKKVYSVVDHPMCEFKTFDVYIEAVEFINDLNIDGESENVDCSKHAVGFDLEFSSINTFADVKGVLNDIVRTIENEHKKEDRWKRINNAKR